MLDTSEQILLFKIRKFRDQVAFTRLFETHKKELYRFVRSKVPTAEDADDLIQTVFMRAWVYITTAHQKETHHFRGLIYHMSRNAIADHYRQRKETFSVEA
ncbi:sigma-70 family RNA polymerase sigma factor, partial [bacterium]|nr:sigma-70 family RNA polymerase sigma factor [bacterium]